ncbi:Fagellar hook-basal body protein, FlgE/F/G [Syntrophomonas zehnderi OL-4]|uniref:Flagellar hook protein FlgE n=1 Tax=Syntrophomonas zehnderi OL-4 TaxID=690567 RepID=A0A0E4GDW2_9FIRM|nr:flagellar hook protein FlgE [Syntrophomonas zehnderi]CFX65142.1 Fagellar hook-basal body protein, FlgE/F/G [Syntrophomonas zehnderi OL-4]
MMRSMYSGVSGLRNHQTRMDVIGNNIANVNTAGFKKSRVVFKDAFYQVSRGASRPTAERGGTNPMAVGLGMMLSSIDQIHTPAPTTTTNKTTDMAIDGNGYFAVNIGNSRYYTRAGAFDFDTDGKLVSTANGYQVQGWMTDRVVNPDTGDWRIDTSADPTGISLQNYKILEPNATTKMQFAGNLDSNTAQTPALNEIQTLSFENTPTTGSFRLQIGGHTTDWIAGDAADPAAAIQSALEDLPNVGAGNVAVVWDAANNRYNITYQNALANTDVPQVQFVDSKDSFDGGKVTTTTVAPDYNELTVPTAANSVVKSRDVYDSLGNKRTVYFRFIKYNVDTSNPGNPVSNWACDISLNPLFEAAPGYDAANDLKKVDLNAAAPASDLPANSNRILRVTGLDFDKMGKMLGQQPDPDPLTLTIERDAIGADDIKFTIDFNSINQFNGQSTAWAEKQNGYKQGNLTSYSIGTDGTIIGIYDNDEARSLARVALFTFENPAGLKQAGSSLFSESSNSGLANMGVPGEGGKGTIIPSSLEMSNVDLSEEFTDMIVTQRGFQANSRIITTSDEMLQELVNLKR